MSDEVSESNARIRQLLDKDEIRDAILRYCRGVDRCDADLISSAYHADATDNHAGTLYTGRDIGPRLVDMLQANFSGHLHHITNQLIVFDGDVAHAETYYFVTGTVSEASGELFTESAGRYIDRFERRDGAWKIADRVVISEISDRRPFGSARQQRPGAVTSSRSRDDRSYQNLGSLNA